MTPKEEIDKQVMDDYDKFERDTYKGAIAVPDTIISLFKAGAMYLASQFHQVSALKIKVIASKHYSELTNSDLNVMIKIIVNTPPDKLYPGGHTFNDAIEGEIKMQKFILCYNKEITEFQKKLEMKKATLESLLNGSRGNSLRIMPH